MRHLNKLPSYAGLSGIFSALGTDRCSFWMDIKYVFGKVDYIHLDLSLIRSGDKLMKSEAKIFSFFIYFFIPCFSKDEVSTVVIKKPFPLR